ncbi:MAG: thioredoxin family protein [Candidatus Scalindua sp.]|nr:thioredoxin family protein [Candidatus Scalindua sp.]MCR4344423.1 thioredoxin family protein [Candidatus Scalindua sp.]
MANIELVVNEYFEQIVIQADLPVLVCFFAEWYSPCKKQALIVNKLAEEFYGKVKFARLDIDLGGNRELALGYDVFSVPTLILFSNGEVKETMIGVTSKYKLKQKIGQIL